MSQIRKGENGLNNEKYDKNMNFMIYNLQTLGIR